MEIDVYADLICPWCYIGKRRLETALDRFDGEVTVRYQPFQLDPATPRGPRPLLDWLGPKFGGLERARAITARTTRVAAEAGIEMHFEDALIANSFEAHRLVWLAHRTGVGPAVVEALHAAHFTEGRDIGSADELAAIGVAAGLDETAVRQFLDSDQGKDEVRAAIDEAYALGITAVPTFVFAGKYAVSGAQEPETLLQVLHEVRRRESEPAPVEG